MLDPEAHLHLALELCFGFHASVSAGGLLSLALVDGAGTPMQIPAMLLAVYQAAIEGVPAEEVHAHLRGMAGDLLPQLGLAGSS